MPTSLRGEGTELYLSRLVLDPRSKRVQREIVEPYEMHRTLMNAFPDSGGTPSASAAHGILFRVDDAPRDGRVMVIVQSAVRPDWKKIEAIPGYLDDSAQPDAIACKPVLAKLQSLPEGALLSFRLRANPTMRRKDNGRRVGLYRENQQVEWLRRKAEAGGFEVVQAMVTKEPLLAGKLTDQAGARHALRHQSVRFEGTLRVADPEVFLQTLRSGIGSGKAFGFGLISLARAG